MLTFIYKFDYKYRNKSNISISDLYFFETMEMRKILKELEKKKL